MAGEEKKYSILDQMSTRDLEEILRLDIYDGDSNDTNTDYILKVMEVLAKRKEKDSPEQMPDVDTAWESFKKHYLPHADNEGSIYDKDTDDEQNLSHSKVKNLQQNTNKPHNLIFLKRVALIAATFIVISTVFINTTAFGATIWKSIAKWGRETFWFSETVAPIQIDERLQNLHDALSEHGITELLAPTWIPQGFELMDFSVAELPEQVIFTSYFENASDTLVILITFLDEFSDSIYEKSDGGVTVYSRNGVEHYIMINEKRTAVVWMNGKYECSMIGNIAEDEAKKIIDSIYER